LKGVVSLPSPPESSCNPFRYTREMLIERLHQDFRGEVNFLYMPIDFSTE